MKAINIQNKLPVICIKTINKSSGNVEQLHPFYQAG